LGNYLIGSYSARFDKSGRIKIPEKFRAAIEEKYGRDVFITSLNEPAIQIYPLSVWEEFAGLSRETGTPIRPYVKNFMRRVNREGNFHEIDSKGRILINQSLQEKARLDQEVEIIGMNTYLEIWDKQVLDQILDQNPLTDDDLDKIAELKSRGDRE
jgi:MraZ protein